MLGYMARGINVTNGIKIAHQLTLRYLGGPNLIPRVLTNGRGKRERKNQKDGSMRRTQPDKAGFENRGVGL